MLIRDRAPVSNADRQRAFRARHPGYRNKYRLKRKKAVAAILAASPTSPVEPTDVRREPTDVRREPTDVRREPTAIRPEPTLFDPFPPFEWKPEEKPIDLHLAGLAI